MDMVWIARCLFRKVSSLVFLITHLYWSFILGIFNNFWFLIHNPLMPRNQESTIIISMNKSQNQLLFLSYDCKLKYGSQEKKSFCCRCSSFLSLTFVEIKESFTEMLLSINYRNFEIFFFVEENRYKLTYLMF